MDGSFIITDFYLFVVRFPFSYSEHNFIGLGQNHFPTMVKYFTKNPNVPGNKFGQPTNGFSMFP